MSDPTVPWWSLIISGLGTGGIVAGIAKIFASRATVEVAETGVRKAEVREDSKQFHTNASFAEGAFIAQREDLRKKDLAIAALSHENTVLNGEVVAKSLENVALKDRIDAQDARLAKQDERIEAVEGELRQCHEGRAADMREFAQWARDNFTPRAQAISEAPMPRSLTPVQGTPGVPKETT